MGKCQNCREKFEPRFKTTEKYCWEPECKEIEIKLYLDDKKKKKSKDWKKEKKALKVNTHAKEYKSELQNEINKLSKSIDEYFNFHCIDCGSPYGKQKDASHFHNVGSHSNIRYNLHNVHTSRSYCNQWARGRKPEYYEGLIDRYGQEYADFVKTELPLKYTYLGLSNQDIVDKLKIVRKLNRDFKTFKLADSISARNNFNKIIGIYT